MKQISEKRSEKHRKEHKNTVLIDVALMLTRNKSREWKKSIIRMETTLAKFLYDNNLLVRIKPFDENNDLKTDLTVRKKDLTDEGFQLFQQGFVDGWYDYLDRSTVPNKYENISRLEKGLQKIIENDRTKHKNIPQNK